MELERSRARSSREGVHGPHAPPSRRDHAPRSSARRAGRRGGRDAAPGRGGDAQARPVRRARASSSTRRSRTTSSCAWCSAATARSCARCSATPAPACRCSRSTSARSASSRRSSRRRSRTACAAPSTATSSCCACPAIVLDARRSRGPRRRPTARGDGGINDVAIHRKVGERVAEIAYALEGEEVGSVRCDGLVVATPAGLHRLQPRQRRAGDGMGCGGLRRVVHRAALAHRARARGRARRPADDPQPLARAARRRRRRAPGRRDRRRAPDDRRAASSRTSGRSPSCPARPSTAACARSSAAWRADGGPARAVGVAGPLAAPPRSCRIEVMNSSSCSRAEAPLTAGSAVAADVPRVGPAADGRQRDAEIARGLRAREHELAVVAWEDGAYGHWSALSIGCSG